MTRTISTRRLQTLVRSLRAARQRRSEQWIQRMEGPAKPDPRRPL